MKRGLSVFLSMLFLFLLAPVAPTPARAGGEALELTWAQGSYEDTLSTASNWRKYTVIPCENGNVFTFRLPSSAWRIRVYAADESGTVYFFWPKDGQTFLVEDVDGRVPSELRVTAVPSPDGAITDEKWATFDVTIEKETGDPEQGDAMGASVWKNGAFYDTAQPNTSLADKRRYAVIPCEEGQVFTFRKPSDWTVFCYPADENGSIDSTWFYITDGLIYPVEKISGRAPTSLRVTAAPKPDNQVITDEMWQGFLSASSCVIREKQDPDDLFDTALWKHGAFYATAAPNTAQGLSRRYAVIPVSEGEVYTFTNPGSAWTIYAYPEDENGSIDSNWFYLTDGLQYEVAKIGERTPTALRVTVCPKPEWTQVTNGMWKTFSASCRRLGGAPGESTADYDLFKKSEWLPGAYFGNALHPGQTRKYTVIPCEKDDTFRFTFEDSAFGLWVYYYDENGELSDFGYTTVKENAEIRITEKNGKTPTELRITAFPIPNAVITDEMWEAFSVSCTRESNHIRVATMNYGLWYNGVTAGVPDEEMETTLAAWKQMLEDEDLAILAGQEWLPFFDRNGAKRVEDCLFSEFYRYQYSVTTGNGKNLVSRTECTSFGATSFSTNSSRQYVKAYTEINGKRVCLINAHCSLETDFSVSRKAEFEELVSLMDEEAYVIVFGDFNAFDVSEFDVFKNAGYTVANGGAFGVMDTWTNFDKPSSSWPNRAIDNIIVSPTIRILDAKVDRRDLSDHSMLAAELLLLEDATAPAANTIIMEDDFSLRYLFHKIPMENAGITKVLVSADGENWNETALEPYNSRYSGAVVKGISPKAIGDTIYLKTSENGEVDEWSLARSCQTVAENAAGAFSGKFVALAKALLSYGAAAKQKFEYPGPEISVYADAPSAGAYEDLADTGEKDGKAVQIVGTSLILEDAVSIRFLILPGAEDAAGLVAKVNGTEVPLTQNGKYLTATLRLPAKKMRDAATAEVYQNGVLVSNTYTDSVSSYCAWVRDHSENAALKTLCEKLMAYVDAAIAYLN